MSYRIKWVLALFSFIFLSSCAHVISKDLRANVDPHLTFIQVYQNPNIYKGKLVVWDGEIIETVIQKDGTTEIEVLQRPLGWKGEAKGILAPEGRFLIRIDKYLDPYVYRKARKITVAAEILGEKIKSLYEKEYRYPLLSSKQIYLWEEYYCHRYPYYYYDPWWETSLRVVGIRLILPLSSPPSSPPPPLVLFHNVCKDFLPNEKIK
jgi:outer membrane lipoprotein